MNTIELARALGHSIQNEECYKNIEKCSDAVEADAELGALMEEFAQKRELAMTKTDEEELRALDTELEKLYNTIMANEKMKAFEAAKDQFSELMVRIIAIVTKSADGEDPDTAEPDEPCHDDCCSCGDHHCGHHHH